MSDKLFKKDSIFLNVGNNRYIAAVVDPTMSRELNLAVYEDGVVNMYATFNTESGAREFMNRLAKMMEGAE